LPTGLHTGAYSAPSSFATLVVDSQNLAELWDGAKVLFSNQLTSNSNPQGHQMECHAKNVSPGIIWKALDCKMLVNYRALWYFYGSLVYFMALWNIWYILSGFGVCLETLHIKIKFL
jgi:hypothetical protein